MPRAYSTEKKAYDRRYRAQHLDEIRAKQRAYYARNAEKIMAYQSRYARQHRDQRRMYNRRSGRGSIRTVTDDYLRRLLKTVKAAVSPELLEAKRAQILLWRLIHQGGVRPA